MSGMGERFDVPLYPILAILWPSATDFHISLTLSWEIAGSNGLSFQFVEHL
jgi:hypothetical protein